jgi:hypothetical protein
MLIPASLLVAKAGRSVAGGGSIPNAACARLVAVFLPVDDVCSPTLTAGVTAISLITLARGVRLRDLGAMLCVLALCGTLTVMLAPGAYDTPTSG